MHRASDFDYELPAALIAQEPLPDRAASRLLVLERATGAIRHRSFRDIVDLIAAEDVLVLNTSRVIPARLHGLRGRGAPAELLLVRELTDGVDYAFSAITSPTGLVDAVRMCGYGGTATLVGVPPPGRTLEVDIELDLFHPKVAIAVTHGGDTIPQQDFPFLAQAALEGRLDLDRFVTKTISLDEVADALDELHAPKGIRTVVKL